MPALAENLMQVDVVSVRPDLDLGELARTMVDTGVSGFPVVDDDGEVLGVVSRSDLVHARAHDEDPAEVLGSLHEKLGPHPRYQDLVDDSLDGATLEQLQEAAIAGLTVGDVMNPNVYSVEAHEEVREVAEAMVRHGVKRLLVTRRGRLAGVISAMDLVAHLAGRPRRR